MAGLLPPPGGAPPAPGPDMAALQSQHDATVATYGKTSGATAMLRTARGALDKLVALGDKVGTEDVLEAGATMVGAGMDPKAIGAMMAGLPQGGEALAGWVQQQDQGMREREAALAPAHAATRHHMGVNALRLIAGHHLGGQGNGTNEQSAGAGAGGSPSPSAPGGTPLVPGLSAPAPGDQSAS